MNSLVNEVTLVGRVGSLKETTTTKKEGVQSAILAISIVTEEGYYSKEADKKYVERSVWHKGVIFGEFAKKIIENKSVVVGNMYIFRGRLAYKDSEGKDKDGNKVLYNNASIVIEKIKYISKPKAKDDTSSEKSPDLVIEQNEISLDEIPF